MFYFRLAPTVCSELPLLDEAGYAVDHRIVFVGFGMETGLHVHAEEFSECLPESGTETSEEGLDDVE